MATATETISTLRTSAATYQPMADYSDKVKLVYSSKNQLAAALQLAAELIVPGTGVKLLHLTLGGFDTHYTELNRHDDLMGYLDSAVGAFYQDLAAHGKADKVLIATWSEFGRRPQENASGGTDHGAAAPLLLIGDPVKGGLYGEAPNLTNLDGTGNLKYAVDFRSVYQEILGGHLGAGSSQILGASFDRVPFLKVRSPGLTLAPTVVSALYVTSHLKNPAAPLQPAVLSAARGSTLSVPGGSLTLGPSVQPSDGQPVTSTYAS